MALGWLTVLKTVPWTQVLGHAPVVAEGARKLWNAVGHKPAEAEVVVAPEPPSGAVDAPRLEAIERRLAAAESAMAQLQEQVRTSSGLITALADQNEALVKGMEALRARVVWLTAGCLLAGLVAIGALVVLAGNMAR